MQLLDCVPAVALSVVEAVHVQRPQSDQPPSTLQPLAVQGPEPSDQAPAVSLSRVFAVHSQVRQLCVLQDRLCVSVGNPRQVPPHPSSTILLLVLLCVPPSQVALQTPQGLQSVQDPHRQSRGCVPVARCVSLSRQSPMLQLSLHSLVLVCVKVVSQACVEVAGDHGVHGSSPHSTHVLVPFTRRRVEQSPVLQPALQLLVCVRVTFGQNVALAGDHGSEPQTTVVGVHDLVPLARRLVEQSPTLQSAGHVLVCVKDCPEQTVEVAGDHDVPHPTHVLVPLALRLAEQSPVLQPALQVRVCVKDMPEQNAEAAGDHEAPQRTHDFVPLALRLVAQSPVLQPLLQVLVCVKDWPEQTVEVAGDHVAVPQLTGATGFSAEHTPEFDPPPLPSQRHW